MRTIHYWLHAALEANRRDHSPAFTPTMPTMGDQRGPIRSARALGMTLIAMHDAYVGVASSGPTHYRVPRAPDPALHAEIAAAAAAHAALRALYPKQMAWLLETWRHFAATTSPDLASIDRGEAVAAAVLAWRASDGALFEAPFTPSLQPYEHDVDPLHPAQGFQGVAWGNAAPFLEGLGLQPLDPPPGRSASGFTPNGYYFAEWDEVRRKGAELSSDRSAEEEEIGIFWGYDGSIGVGTPPRLYMQITMKVLDGIAAQHNSWLTPVRYLEAATAVAVVMADAGIQAWHYKYSRNHMLWRPVLGIRRAPPGHPEAVAVAAWRPLGAPSTNDHDLAVTPNFPSYPSGHATFGAAAFEVLRRFIRKGGGLTFGDGEEDTIAFTFRSDEFDGANLDPRTNAPRVVAPRHYRSLWQAIVENSESRIWLGVHWRFDGISKLQGKNTVTGSPKTPGELGKKGGVRLGMDIAREFATIRGFAS